MRSRIFSPTDHLFIGHWSLVIGHCSLVIASVLLLFLTLTACAGPTPTPESSLPTPTPMPSPLQPTVTPTPIPELQPMIVTLRLWLPEELNPYSMEPGADRFSGRRGLSDPLHGN